MNIKRLFVFLLSGIAVSVSFVIFRWDGEGSVYAVAADGLTLPGVVFTGLGALKMISRTGVYNIFGYAAKSVLCLVFSGKRRESYISYVKGKENIGKASDEMLYVGAVFLSAALILCCFCI